MIQLVVDLGLFCQLFVQVRDHFGCSFIMPGQICKHNFEFLMFFLLFLEVIGGALKGLLKEFELLGVFLVLEEGSLDVGFQL